MLFRLCLLLLYVFIDLVRVFVCVVFWVCEWSCSFCFGLLVCFVCCVCVVRVLGLLLYVLLLIVVCLCLVLRFCGCVCVVSIAVVPSPRFWVSFLCCAFVCFGWFQACLWFVFSEVFVLYVFCCFCCMRAI